MAKQVYRFSGKAAYVSRLSKTFKTEPNKPVWTMNFYPVTAADRMAVRNTGIKNNVKEDTGEKSGVEGFFYIFRSNEEYAVLENGDPISADVRVANGATVEIELEVETFNSPKFGPQARSKLLAVHLIDWQPYVAEKTEAAQTDLPA